MKRILLYVFLAVATVSCTKNDEVSKTQTVTVQNKVNILEAVRVREPNGDMGRKLTLQMIVVDSSKVAHLKMYKHSTANLYYIWDYLEVGNKTVVIYDHNAGYSEVYYIFKWEYKDGTEEWQTPIKTTVQ